MFLLRVTLLWNRKIRPQVFNIFKCSGYLLKIEIRFFFVNNNIKLT